MSTLSRLILFSTVVMIAVPLFSQGEIDLQPRMLYRNEKSAAVYLNSYGIGAGFRFGQRVDARNQVIYEADFLAIKHPKEIKLSNNIYSNRGFVFGKKNSFFELRGMYGKQYEMFRKNDKGGISVRSYFSGGPAIGFIKPIYYEVLYSAGGPYEYYLKTEKFNTTIHQSNIYGRSSFFKGIKELSVVPGASVKAGLGFEYSRLDVTLHSLEAGVSLDVFTKKIPIMANGKDDFLFFNLFVSYRIGKYMDVSEAALAKSGKFLREQKRLSRKISRDQKKQEKADETY